MPINRHASTPAVTLQQKPSVSVTAFGTAVFASQLHVNSSWISVTQGPLDENPIALNESKRLAMCCSPTGCSPKRLTDRNPAHGESTLEHQESHEKPKEPHRLVKVSGGFHHADRLHEKKLTKWRRSIDLSEEMGSRSGRILFPHPQAIYSPTQGAGTPEKVTTSQTPEGKLLKNENESRKQATAKSRRTGGLFPIQAPVAQNAWNNGFHTVGFSGQHIGNGVTSVISRRTLGKALRTQSALNEFEYAAKILSAESGYRDGGKFTVSTHTVDKMDGRKPDESVMNRPHKLGEIMDEILRDIAKKKNGDKRSNSTKGLKGGNGNSKQMLKENREKSEDRKATMYKREQIDEKVNQFYLYEIRKEKKCSLNIKQTDSIARISKSEIETHNVNKDDRGEQDIKKENGQKKIKLQKDNTIKEQNINKIGTNEERKETKTDILVKNQKPENTHRNTNVKNSENEEKSKNRKQCGSKEQINEKKEENADTAKEKTERNWKNEISWREKNKETQKFNNRTENNQAEICDSSRQKGKQRNKDENTRDSNTSIDTQIQPQSVYDRINARDAHEQETHTITPTHS
ncbi:unnamed protein product, partial [Dicrocoelium dendriticum]